jgi:hypothetical protein
MEYEKLEPFGPRHEDLAAILAGAHLLAAWTGKQIDVQAMADQLLPEQEEDSTSTFEDLARALGAEGLRDAG